MAVMEKLKQMFYNQTCGIASFLVGKTQEMVDNLRLVSQQNIVQLQVSTFPLWQASMSSS